MLIRINIYFSHFNFKRFGKLAHLQSVFHTQTCVAKVCNWPSAMNILNYLVKIFYIYKI